MSDEATVTAPTTSSESALQPTQLRPGQLFGARYAIVSLIGRGGMGDVYRADDVRLQQPVALKLMRASATSTVQAERIATEVRLAREVSHPNVCRVYDLGSAGGVEYLSMEFVDGQTLAARMRSGGVPMREARELAIEIASGLAAAHERDVLHRDIKPANIMVDRHGHARILDFGVAAMADGVGHGFVGTPAYIAPEQLRGEPPSKRSDVYALGLVLCELFTGTRLITATSIADRIDAGPQSPGPLALRDIEVTMQAVITWCLADDPAARPRSAVEVVALLRGGAVESTIGHSPIPSPELILASGDRPPLRSIHATALTGAALIATVLVGSQLNQILRLDGALPIAPPALAVSAQKIAESAGVPTRGDRAFWFAPDRRVSISDAHAPRPVLFFYRHQSSANLVPGNIFHVVKETDPPSSRPGMTMVVLDGFGRLLHFDAVDEVPSARTNNGVVDWSTWFAAAGLNVGDFGPADAGKSFAVPYDRQLAWRGRGADGRTLVVTAALLGNRLAYFNVGDNVPADAESSSIWSTHRGPLAEALFWVLIVVVFATGALIVYRYSARGRGHRQAANRVAALVAIGGIAATILRAHHVPDVIEETAFVIGVAGWSLVWAVFSWICYLALEPSIRRCAPYTLVAWTRFLAGRFRDPVVGRDVLIGVAGGLAIVAIATLRFRLMPERSADMMLYPSLESLPSWSRFWYVHLFGITDGVETALGGAFLVALLARFVRNVNVATYMVALLTTPLALGGVPLSLADGALAVAIMLTFAIVFTRAGVLALIVTHIVERLMVRVPVTLEPAEWYVVGSIVTLTLVAAIAVYGGFASHSDPKRARRPSADHDTLIQTSVVR